MSPLSIRGLNMKFCSHLFSLVFHIVSFNFFSTADTCCSFTVSIVGLPGSLSISRAYIFPVYGMTIGAGVSIICSPPRPGQIGPQNRTVANSLARLVIKRSQAGHLRRQIEQPPRSQYPRPPICPRDSVNAIEIRYLCEGGSASALHDHLHTYRKVSEYCATPEGTMAYRTVLTVIALYT